MELVNLIDKKLKELFFSCLEGTIDIESELMKEAGFKEEEAKNSSSSKSFSSSLFSLLAERLYKLCLGEKKIINSPYLIKNLPKEAGLSLEIVDPKVKRKTPEIYPGIVLHEDTFMKVLDALNLAKTKQVYVNWLIINYEEADAKRYLNENQIEKYKEEYAINNTFGEEYAEKKLDLKPKVINIKSETKKA